jgi:integral membrane protein
VDGIGHNQRVNTLRNFRWVALAEATSFLALLVATALKYSDKGETGVQVLGPIHGMLFLAYLALALIVRPELRWSNRTTILVLIGAVLPFGGYVVDRWLAKQPVPA